MDSNNPNNETKDLQLENETPTDLTVIENPNNLPAPEQTKPTENKNLFEENFSISEKVENSPATTQTINEAQSMTEPQPVVESQPLIQSQVQNPAEAIQSPANLQIQNQTQSANPLSSLEFSSSKAISNSNTQKYVVLAGALFGVLLVAGAGYFFISNQNKSKTQIATQTPETPVEVIKAPVNQEEPQVEVSLSLAEYQAAINEIDMATNTILTKYPINLSQNKIDPESIRFASEELFANYQKISNLKYPQNAKDLNQNLTDAYQKLSQSYDLILKTYKESNTITAEVKTQFTKDYNLALSNLKVAFEAIKALK